MTFREKWLVAVKAKNSVLCAGIDPAVFEMGRGEKGLAKFNDVFRGAGKRSWCENYIKSIAPFAAAVKPNFQYFKGHRDVELLEEISSIAHELGMVVIRDDKLADIGSTNDAGMFYVKQSRADAVTFSPFAGNMEEAVNQGKKHDLGVISMCLMSNPEYAGEKAKLVYIGDCADAFIHTNDLFKAPFKQGGQLMYAPQFIKLARDAQKFGIDGLVIGAPSSKNHITPKEIETVREYVDENMLVLLPGVGAQGGEAGAIWKYFGPENVIVNVGRNVMFPNGQESTPEEQAAAAKQYMEMLNSLRAA